MSNVITIGNFKGGVGKTTVTTLFSYLLMRDNKVLLIDFDPQANATEIIKATFGDSQIPARNNFYEGIKKQDLNQSITVYDSNLHCIEGDWNMVKLPSLLEDYKKSEKDLLLSYLIKDIKKDYDYVLIDVPPTLSDFTNNALVASDYVVVPMQTQEQALTSSVKFIQYIKDIKNSYSLNLELLGIIPYLIKRNGTVDIAIMNEAKELFNGAIYKENIFQRERVKGFAKNGIKNTGIHDERVLYMYSLVLNETLERIDMFK